MNNREIVMNFFKSFPEMLSSVPYHSELPSDIAEWHCYVADCGHNILSLPKCLVEEALASNNIQGFLAPVSVKTVLRGYQMLEGYVVVDVKFDPLLGIDGPEDDEEY